MAKEITDIIEEIKSRCDIANVISSYINIKPSGANYKGLCPFHGEKTPSFYINTSKQIYKCFTCLASGNVFTFVQNYENISFVEAVKKVADKIGYQLDIKDKIGNKNSKY